MFRSGFFLAVIAATFIANQANATALKVCNDTYYSWRVSVDGGVWQDVHSQGSCKCYQSGQCPYEPGNIHNSGWIDIANDVKDEWYRVRFQYRAENTWNDAFDIYMQGNYFTNVAQIIDDESNRIQILRMWWEPPQQLNGGNKCRSKPRLQGCRESSCLFQHDDDPEYSRKY